MFEVNHSIFDQFLLIGIPPTGTADDPPEVLAAFPPHEIPGLPTAILKDYALPYGSKPLKPPGFEDLVSDMFIFTISNNNIKYYGSTIIINPTISPLPFFTSEFTKNTLYAFVIISRNEFISAHLTFLTFLILFSSGKISNPNILSPKKHHATKVSDAFKGYLVTNHIAHHKDMPLPIFFTDPIHTYYKYEAGFEPLQLSPTFIVSIPEPSTIADNVINCTCFDTLFSSLEVEDIISLVTALLTDRQIVVFGTNLQQVSTTVISLVNLIHPVEYAGVVIPSIPEKPNFMTILEAPTPFIIGCKACDELTNIEFDESSVFVNLDANKIEAVTKIPEYPNYDSIVRKLKRILSNSRRAKLHQFSFPFFYRASIKQSIVLSKNSVSEIVNTFKNPLSCVYTDEVYPFFMTNIYEQNVTTDFNKDLFITMCKEDSKPFFEELFNSQSFCTYIESILAKFAEERGQSVKSKERRKLSRRQSSRKISMEFMHL